jgi:alkylhydroperoxidase family enzyme
MLDDTRQRLMDWGTWVRTGGVSSGYAAVNLVASSNCCSGYEVADDEALKVDRAVARLKLREPQLGKVVLAYYVRRWDYSMIGLDVKLGREKVRVLLRSAEAWIDGAMS